MGYDDAMKDSADDPNVTAHSVLGQLLDHEEMRRELMREMGRRGGLKGGNARSAALSPERRSEIARAAGRAPKKRKA
jgi:general stress protein YciG